MPTRAGRRFGVRSLLVFVAVLLVALPFSALVLLVRAKSDPVLNLDHRTADGLHGFAVDHPSFTWAMKVVSAAGSSIGWWIVLAPVVLWLLWRRLPRLAAFVVVTALGSSLLNSLVKAWVDRARPHLLDPVASAGGLSFPSGHAQAATVGCGILLLVFLPAFSRPARKWLWLAAAVVIALIAFSRIALGVHYLSDVVAGAIIGAAWLLAMTAAFSAWRREEGRPAVRPSQGLEPEDRERLTPGDAGPAE